MNTRTSRIFSVAAGAVSSFLFVAVAMSITHPFVVYYAISNEFSTVVNLKFVRTACIVFAILASYPVVWEFLVQLSKVGKLPEKVAQRILRSVEPPASNTLVLPRSLLMAWVMSVASGGILLLIALMGRTGFLPTDEISMSLYETISFVRKSDVRIDGYPHVINAYFSTQGKDPNLYAEDCLTLAKIFKKAGARGVVFPLPESESGSNIEVWRAVDSTEIAIVGSRIPFNWIWKPVPGRAHHGTYSYNETSYYSRFKRTKIFEPELLNIPNPPSDLLIPLIKLYLNLPLTAPIAFDGSRLKIGTIEIPCSEDGIMRCRTLFWPRMPSDLGIRRIGSTTRAPMYLGDDKTEAMEPSTPEMGKLRIASLLENPGGTPIPLDSAALRSRISGKIVLVTSNIAQRFSTSVYANAFESILSGTVTRKVPNGHLWYSLLALLVAGGVTILVRPLLASVLVLFTGMIFAYVGSVLLDSNHILIDIIYPLLAIGISSFMFPVLKFAVLSGGQGK